MQSKKFSSKLINKALLKRNIRGFWPLSVMYFIYLFFFSTMTVLFKIGNILNNRDYYSKMNCGFKEYLASQVESCYSYITEPISVAIMAVLAVMAVFAYLYNSRSSLMIHSFPVTKLSLFVTNVISALIILVLPQFVVFLSTALVATANGVNVWAVAVESLLFQFAYDIFFVAFASFVAMFTGLILVVPVFYTIFNLLYIGVQFIWYWMRQLLTADMAIYCTTDIEAVNVLFPMAYLTSRTGFETNVVYDEGSSFYYDVTSLIGGMDAFLFVIAGLLIMAAAYLVYRARANETYSEFVSIPATKPLFRLCMGFFGGLLFASSLVGIYELIIEDVTRIVSLVFCISAMVGAVIFCFAAEMFVKKSYRVFNKKILIQGLSCCVFVVIFALVGKYTAVNEVNYLPDKENVKMAGIYGDIVVTSTEDDDTMDGILEINRYLTENMDVISERVDAYDWETFQDYQYQNIDIKFVMKNGKKYEKTFGFYYDPDATDDTCTVFAGMYKNIQKEPENIKSYLFTKAYENADVITVSAYNPYSYMDEDGLSNADDYNINRLLYTAVGYVQAEDYENLYRAVLKDIDEGNINAGNMYVNEMLEISFFLKFDEPVSDEFTIYQGYDKDTVATNSIYSIGININCENTINYLIDAMGENGAELELEYQAAR